MLPDLVSSLIGLVLVCVAVLDKPLLDTQHALIALAGIALVVLGAIAKRVDYLKWPGIAVAAAGVAITVLITSGLAVTSPETAYWVVFWSGTVAGLTSLWSAFYRRPRESQEEAERLSDA